MYATLSDMIARIEAAELIQLTDDVDAGVIGVALVERALTDAAAEIDSYVMVRYALPLPQLPAVMVPHGVAIARAKLWERKGDLPDAVKSSYDAAIRWLKSLSSGQVRIDIGGAEPAAQSATILMDTPERLFSRQTLRGL